MMLGKIGVQQVEGGLPQARIVRGRHAPAWSAQPIPIPGESPCTYARVTPMAESTLALLYGLWPLLFITAMGIALLWSGTVYGTP